MNNLVEKFVDIGLTENEAKIYYYLLEHGGATATELSKALKINRTNSYNTMSNLVTKGMCKEISGKVTKYYAISPTDSFNLLKDNFEKKITSIELLSKVLMPIYEKSSTKEKLINFIEILHSKASITAKISQIEKQTQKTVMVFSKPPYIHNPPKNNKKLGCIGNKGVKYRFLYEKDNSMTYKQLAEYYCSHYGTVKIIDKLPIKMMIFDKHYIIFSILNECSNDITTVFFNNTQMANTMAELFEIYWDKAKPFKE